jgi:hypothetical protein
MAGREVVLPELHDGEGAPRGARVHEADRFHGAEEERVAAPAGDDLDGEAALEEELVVEGVELRALRGGQGAIERVVLRFVERAVHVVVAALAVARRAERPREVDRLRVHHRADGVVEVEMGLPHEGGDLRRQRIRRQGTGGHDDDRPFRDPRASPRGGA